MAGQDRQGVGARGARSRYPVRVEFMLDQVTADRVLVALGREQSARAARFTHSDLCRQLLWLGLKRWEELNP